MGKARIYIVVDKQDQKRLVRATTKQQAIGFCARTNYNVRLAQQEELYEAAKAGSNVEDATKDEEEAEAATATS